MRIFTKFALVALLFSPMALAANEDSEELSAFPGALGLFSGDVSEKKAVQEPYFWEPAYLQPAIFEESPFGVFAVGSLRVTPKTTGKYTLLYGGEVGMTTDFKNYLVLSFFMTDNAPESSTIPGLFRFRGAESRVENIIWGGIAYENRLFSILLLRAGVSWRHERSSVSYRYYISPQIPGIPKEYGSGRDYRAVENAFNMELGGGFNVDVSALKLRLLAVYHHAVYGTAQGLRSNFSLNGINIQLALGVNL
ncbi:MAG: hypothetical protein NZL89_00090 [Leptospiraceae bacterium]|nr:hypothetical protein [Leptospiraceae bacterium]